MKAALKANTTRPYRTQSASIASVAPSSREMGSISATPRIDSTRPDPSVSLMSMEK